ncbi:MAG: ribose 5-phosphate isomerase B [Bacteriovoracaceae bacterium]|nr:ribose 5-phosphate isomerase B [Bacteroidota bacterium]
MIAIASDHAGFHYKERVKTFLKQLNVQYKDFGTNSPESVDYPDFAHAASDAVSSGECDLGILVCGSGIGVSIVANKHKGIRAAACESVTAAELSRRHNNANILCFGERLVGWGVAEDMIRVFLNTNFEAGRHTRRVEKIHSLTGR